MEASEANLDTTIESGVDLRVLEEPQTVRTELDPVDLTDGYFVPGKHHRIRGSVTRQFGQLAELPEEMIRLAVDLGEIGWAEARRAKVEAFSRRERESIDVVHRRHFAGFRRDRVGFTSTNSGDRYELAVMEREGTGPHSDTAIVYTHGWFGRYESFAEQAHPESMRDFTQIMYNRPGTDVESAGLIREPGYTTADHWLTNLTVAEQMLERAFDRGARRVVKVGHSFGGILDQLMMQTLAERHPEWMDKLVFVPTNTTWPKDGNVVNGSFLDRIPGSGRVIKVGIEQAWQTSQAAGRVHRRIRGHESPSIESADEELTERVKEGLKVAMTVGYFDSMVGGDAKRDVYLASKGRAKQNDGRAMVMDGLAMLRLPDLRPERPIRYPTFVVTGGRDQLLPDTGHLVAEHLVQEDREEHLVREFFFQNSGHCTPMTEPRVFNSLLREIAIDPHAVLERFGTRTQYRLRSARAAD